MKHFGQERRRYVRIKRNFVLTYFIKGTPEEKYEISQLKNISKGGMCFVTTNALDENLLVGIELRTPYLSDTTYIEGKVLESHEKVRDMIYETRLQFQSLDSQAEFLLDKLVEIFTQGENQNESN
jgi:c-di-GMP-binding flagellar brake protein YcgR